MLGAVPTVDPQLSGDFATLMEWADANRRLKVRTNAETPLDANTAVKFGAEGIGLCRTEHMFFQPDRIVAMQEMILADDAEGRTKALAKILPMQRADFVELFEIMAGLPVTIRLLDPPLHEFLPHEEAELASVATGRRRRRQDRAPAPGRSQGIQPDAGPARLPAGHPVPRDLRDAGAGHLRGRVRGRGRDRADGRARGDDPADPGGARAAADQAADRRGGGRGRQGAWRRAGVPGRHHDRAAARGAARRRDRGARRVLQLRHQRPHPDDLGPVARRQRQVPRALHPRRDLPRRPVPDTRRQRRGRAGRARGRARPGRRGPTSSSGICGEHGGDPASVAFCERVGLDYVSCSPYRVPIARLAAAQAALRAKQAH